MEKIEWNRTNFINYYQRERYESAKLASEKLKQNPLTAEQLRAQCKRLAEQVNAAETKEREERKLKKKRSKDSDQ